MNIDKLKEIIELREHKTNSYTAEKWEEIEREMGVQLPYDYKNFIDKYGTVNINEFIWVLTPFDKDEYVNLIKRGQEISKAYIESSLNNPEYFKHEVFPIKGGILPWAYTENGDEIYWLTVGKSDEWSIVVYESRSSDYYEYKIGMVEFIYGLISGKLICPAFPEDFMEE